MTWEESLVPITIICVIFFLWGFAYGFIDVLDAQFRQATGHPLQTSYQLHAAYFGAYLFGPFFVARPILNRMGFTATLVTGLLIYSSGTLAFWPAAVLISLPGFVISNLVTGLGVSVIETAADLFIALCGPVEYAEMRLSFAQGVQAVGSIASPLLAHEVLFGDVTTPTALISIQWTYLAISIIAILVAVAYNLIQLPEASSNELKMLAEQRHQDYSAIVCSIRVVWVTLGLGVLSQFCNIGAQENLQTKFQTFVLYNESR
jgi:fucose permease